MAATVAAAASAAGSSAVVVTKPTGTANGDLLIAVHASDWGTAAAHGPPSGCTTLSTSKTDSGSNNMHIVVGWKIAASEGTSYTFANTDADSACAVLRITGHETTPTIAQVAGVSFAVGTTAIAAPTITPNGTDDLLITFYTAEAGFSGATTFSTPTGMTEQADVQSTTWTTLAVDSLGSPSSPSGTKTATFSSASQSGGNPGAVTISIKSAAGGGTTHQMTATGSSTTGGSAALVQRLDLRTTGSSTSGGSVALIQTLDLRTTGSSTTGGSAALTLNSGPVTHQITATGSSASGGSAALVVTITLTATGSSTSGGSATPGLLLSVSATGSSVSGGSAAIGIVAATVHQVSATGSSTTGGSVALIATWRLGATGTSASGGSAGPVLLQRLSSTGSATSGGSVALVIVPPAQTYQLTATGTSGTGGSAALTLAAAVYVFEPPTHPEPIRSPRPPLNHYHLTWALSVVRIGGVFRGVRLVEVPSPGVEGVDFFRGGYVYQIDRPTALELQAAGYNVQGL